MIGLGELRVEFLFRFAPEDTRDGFDAILDVLFPVALFVYLHRGDDTVALDCVMRRLDGFEHFVNVICFDDGVRRS